MTAISHRNAMRGSLIIALACSVPCEAPAQQMMQTQRVYTGAGWLGMNFSRGSGFSAMANALMAGDSAPTRLESWPVVMRVETCSPAETAGFEIHDVLVEIDGRDARIEPLFGNKSDPGVTHVVTVRRAGELVELTVTRGEPVGVDEDPTDRCERGRDGALGLSYSLLGLGGSLEDHFLAITNPLMPGDSVPMPLKSYPVVVDVAKCSPAEAAGFEIDDELMEIDGKDARIRPIFGFANRRAPGVTQVVTVRRDGKLVELTVTRGEPYARGEEPEDRCEQGL